MTTLDQIQEAQESSAPLVVDGETVDSPAVAEFILWFARNYKHLPLTALGLFVWIRHNAHNPVIDSEQGSFQIDHKGTSLSVKTHQGTQIIAMNLKTFEVKR